MPACRKCACDFIAGPEYPVQRNMRCQADRLPSTHAPGAVSESQRQCGMRDDLSRSSQSPMRMRMGVGCSLAEPQDISPENEITADGRTQEALALLDGARCGALSGRHSRCSFGVDGGRGISRCQAIVQGAGLSKPSRP